MFFWHKIPTFCHKLWNVSCKMSQSSSQMRSCPGADSEVQPASSCKHPSFFIFLDSLAFVEVKFCFYNVSWLRQKKTYLKVYSDDEEEPDCGTGWINSHREKRNRGLIKRLFKDRFCSSGESAGTETSANISAFSWLQHFIS